MLTKAQALLLADAAAAPDESVPVRGFHAGGYTRRTAKALQARQLIEFVRHGSDVSIYRITSAGRQALQEEAPV